MNDIYKVKIQLRDTTLEFTTALDRDKKLKAIKNALVALGISEDNIILTSIDSKYSDFIEQYLDKVKPTLEVVAPPVK